MTEESPGDLAFQLESRLMSKGIYVTDVDEEGTRYELTYESAAVDESGSVPHREVGRVINLFRDLHPDDWQGADIEATVTDFDGTELGRWHVEQEWLAALEAGDLTETEFSAKVIETVGPVER